MQTCYNCGKVVPDTTLICPECGALVRRYTSPPPRQSEAEPNAWQPLPVPADPTQQTSLPPDFHPRLRIGVRVWIILQLVLSGYLLMSTMGLVFAALEPEEFVATVRELLQMPGMEALHALVGDTLDELTFLLPRLLPVFAIVLACIGVKIGCFVSLLGVPRRRAFRIDLGASLLGLLLTAVTLGNFIYILYFLEPLLTWRSLRRIWPWM